MLELDTNQTQKDQALIKVIGVGGGGSNTINYMVERNVSILNELVSFTVLNTDTQALQDSSIRKRINIGEQVTEGLGAGNCPERGKEAALESAVQIEKELTDNTQVVFLTAGMGGGTGTGAVPEVARIAKERDLLVIAVVTMPFLIEGELRHDQAVKGIRELQEHVDSLLVIHNENLFNDSENPTVSEAFGRVNQVLTTATLGLSKMLTFPGINHNTNQADIEKCLRRSDFAIMGTATAAGDKRAEEAVNKALQSKLMNNTDISTAKNVLCMVATNLRSVTAAEAIVIKRLIRQQIDNEVDVLLQDIKEEEIGEEIEVTVIVTGIKETHKLDDRRTVLDSLDLNTQQPKKGKGPSPTTAPPESEPSSLPRRAQSTKKVKDATFLTKLTNFFNDASNDA